MFGGGRGGGGEGLWLSWPHAHGGHDRGLWPLNKGRSRWEKWCRFISTQAAERLTGDGRELKEGVEDEASPCRSRLHFELVIYVQVHAALEPPRKREGGPGQDGLVVQHVEVAVVSPAWSTQSTQDSGRRPRLRWASGAQRSRSSCHVCGERPQRSLRLRLGL